MIVDIPLVKTKRNIYVKVDSIGLKICGRMTLQYIKWSLDIMSFTK